MSLLTWLLIAWSVPTLIWLVLLMYRGTLEMHEDDQLFLDESEAAMAKEQTELLTKMGKLTTVIRICGGLSIVMILIIFGIWVYNGLSQT